ncbi:hypothetical protein AYO43_04380 [Nitrospira sp. SCGC AG-212-E16]|nr:hypothetical protein AYO43_04380 [Nitrospira sp. SCGC AG-212-E16]
MFVQRISLRNFLVTAVGILVVLLSADLLGLVSRYAFGHPSVYGLVPLFDFWGEANIPTFYNTSLLVLNSLLFFIVWKVHRQAGEKAGYWGLFSVVFSFLAIDEHAGIHEKLNEALSALHFTGAFHFAWIIPYSLAALAFGLAGIPTLLRLETSIRIRLFCAGLVYVLGAVGMEAFEGLHRTASGVERDFIMDLLVAGEETLEMLGLIMCAYSLLLIIINQVQGKQLIFLLNPQ